MILALRGYPEQAIAEGQTALRLAHELDNPPNLAYAQCFGAHLHQFLRDGPALVRQAEKGMLLASAQGMRPFAKVAELLHGWARMECGEVDEGAAQVHGVLARARARKKPTVMMAYYLTLLADACARTGDQREGLAILADAFEMMEIADERLWEAELHRLKGELLLKDDSTERTRAERSFRQGIAVARRQEARLLELRASTSLARLWHDRGKTSDARDLLAPIYAWFEEGFDAADLKDAKALLDALR
jgi:predicted ATPase